MYVSNYFLECKFIYYFRLSQKTLKLEFTKAEFTGPLMDDWKVTDDSSVNFHDVFFFIFCQIIAKNEEKRIIEIYE